MELQSLDAFGSQLSESLQKTGMTFKDLKKLDKFNAFENFVSVREAKILKMIPDKFQPIFPDKCECGAENIIRTKLTQIQCCDPRCPIKVAYMLDEMFDRFGCKNIGPATCLSLIKDMNSVANLRTHVEALTLNSYDLPTYFTSSQRTSFATAMMIIYSKELTLGELIKNLAIPTLGDGMSEVFEDYNDMDLLIKDIKEAGGANYFFNKYGIHSPMKFFYLNEFMDDIKVAHLLLKKNVRDIGLTKIKICITGEVAPNGKYMKKTDFINYLNEISVSKEGIRLFEFEISSAKMSVPFIVADYPSNTSKYTTALDRMRSENNPDILITSTDLINKVIAEVKKFNDN